MSDSHRLHLETYRGQSSSFCTATCSCGWIGSDQPEPEVAEGEWRDHVEGRVPPWVMRPGERRRWRAGRTEPAD